MAGSSSVGPDGAWFAFVDERDEFLDSFSYLDYPRIIRFGGKNRADNPLIPTEIDSPGSWTGLMYWALAGYRWGHWREVMPAMFVADKTKPPHSTGAPQPAMGSSVDSLDTTMTAGEAVTSDSTGWLMLQGATGVGKGTAFRNDVEGARGMEI